MKMIIDISDELKDKICNSTEEWAARYVAGWDKEIAGIIRNGTPLPKGHGELIDKDVVLDMMNHGILEEYITTMGGVIHADR